MFINYGKNLIVYFNLRMLFLNNKGMSKGTLGSYLNRGMPNRILAWHESKNKTK
jgi:hypothetical protein